MWAMIRQAALCVLAGAVAACTHVMPPPTPPASASTAPDEASARVLQRAVDRQGRLDFTLGRARPHRPRHLSDICGAGEPAHASRALSQPSGRPRLLSEFIQRPGPVWRHTQATL